MAWHPSRPREASPGPQAVRTGRLCDRWLGGEPGGGVRGCVAVLWRLWRRGTTGRGRHACGGDEAWRGAGGCFKTRGAVRNRVSSRWGEAREAGRQGGRGRQAGERTQECLRREVKEGSVFARGRGVEGECDAGGAPATSRDIPWTKRNASMGSPKERGLPARIAPTFLPKKPACTLGHRLGRGRPERGHGGEGRQDQLMVASIPLSFWSSVRYTSWKTMVGPTALAWPRGGGQAATGGSNSIATA